MSISVAERRELAALIGCNEQYLYQCLTGRNAMQPGEAVRAEFKTGGRLRRWHLRTKDWHEIWPEFVGTDGAPVPPGPVPQQAAALAPAAAQDAEAVQQG